MMRVFLLVAWLSLFCSCSISNKSSQDENVGITDEEYCQKLRDWGAADAFIDRENSVFSYGVYKEQISGDADAVAKLWYEDAYESGIRGVVECRVVELPKGKMIGRYKPE